MRLSRLALLGLVPAFRYYSHDCSARLETRLDLCSDWRIQCHSDIPFLIALLRCSELLYITYVLLCIRFTYTEIPRLLFLLQYVSLHMIHIPPMRYAIFHSPMSADTGSSCSLGINGLFVSPRQNNNGWIKGHMVVKPSALVTTSDKLFFVST